MAHASSDDLPVISDLKGFRSPVRDFPERLVFNHRAIVVVLCFITTIILGYQATKIQLQAGFEKTLPKAHQYVINYQETPMN